MMLERVARMPRWRRLPPARRSLRVWDEREAAAHPTQAHRGLGWRMPEAAVSVGRGTKPLRCGKKALLKAASGMRLSASD
jgi:hypothetical protein